MYFLIFMNICCLIPKTSRDWAKLRYARHTFEIPAESERQIPMTELSTLSHSLTIIFSFLAYLFSSFCSEVFHPLPPFPRHFPSLVCDDGSRGVIGMCSRSKCVFVMGVGVMGGGGGGGGWASAPRMS